MSQELDLTTAVNSAVELAAQVPGSRSAIFTNNTRHAIAALATAGLTPCHQYSGDWRYSNGSIIEVAKLRGAQDEHRYAGAEFQLIILDGQAQQSDNRHIYLSSRLRAHGPVKAMMAQTGRELRCILIEAQDGPA